MGKLSDIKEIRDIFNNYLDERDGDVDIGGVTYFTHEVLNAVDELGYEAEFNSYVEWQIDVGNIVQDSHGFLHLTDEPVDNMG